MQPSPHAKAIIAQFENCATILPDHRVRAYPDPASPMGRGIYPLSGSDASKGAPWTIGFGNTGATIGRNTIWTMEQCEAAFDAAIAARAAQLNSLLAGAKTTQNQFDAMLSWLYNEGYGNVQDSTLLRLHRAGDYAGAAQEFPKWNKAGGTVSKGLTSRRKLEAALYQTA